MTLPASPARTPGLRADDPSGRPVLLAFGASRWGFDWQRPQHLLTRLARHYRVFHIEEPVATHQDAFLQCTEVAHGVTLVVPHTRCSRPGLHADQLPVLRELLAAFMRQHGLADPLVWTDTPAVVPLLESLAPRGVLYDCRAEPALLGGFAAAHEDALLDAADIVVAAGPSLYERRRTRHAHVHCIPNAVDDAHFAPPPATAAGIEAVSARAIHAAMRSPRLGWFGVVDDRVDLKLVAAIADRRPDWQVVMAGPLRGVAPEALPRRANLHWLGAQTYAILPHLQAHWDVCILPLSPHACARHAAPVETLEFLAGHKAVVSTPVHDVVALHGQVVRVAWQPDAFVEACRLAMCERGPLRRQRQLDALIAVHASSWDRAAERVHRLLVDFARAPAPRAAHAGAPLHGAVIAAAAMQRSAAVWRAPA
jgi:UDP-galactopyranose mutase